ncbi:hypothetical protein ACHQM5_025291 [Ranunculus cassubicifolius]
MKYGRVSISSLCLMVLVMVQVSMAQNIQDILDSHNTARAQVGVGPLAWSDTLATYAQNYAATMTSTCDLVHSGGKYGENLAGSTGSLTYVDSVNMWVAEEQNYDYSSNTCPGGDGVCGHYTQVVWKNTANVGCGGVVCDNGGTFIICSYDPPGNFVGEWPY